jgi:repressor LexA
MPSAAEQPTTIRPTKKQRLLLEYVSSFINEHGYSPCYREIMAGCGYNSVATVALHVNNLIKRGHLQKRDRSARSLEVVSVEASKPFLTNQIKISEEKWLVEIIEARFLFAERSERPSEKEIDSLYVLVGALRVLGLEGAAQSFMPRLSNLKKKLNTKL